MSHEINGVNSMNITVTDQDNDSCRMVVDRDPNGAVRLYVESVANDGCNVEGDDLRALMELMLKACAEPAPF